MLYLVTFGFGSTYNIWIKLSLVTLHFTFCILYSCVHL